MGVLPLVSDGFFGMSGNPLPSILSFFSALLDAEVSIANASEKKESNTKAINGRAGEMSMARRGEEVLIWDKYTQESLETLSGDLLRVLGCSRSNVPQKARRGHQVQREAR